MDEEQGLNLDLGRYLNALKKWYRLIILTTVVAGGLALGLSMLTSPTYQSEAVVAIVTSSVQVSFDPSIKSASAADSTVNVDQTARRKSLTTIATSPDIANAVIAKIGNQLTAEQQDPNVLPGSINAVNDGDLIRITAKASTPEKAVLLANTWAQEYVARVNSVYAVSGLSIAEIQSQTDTAKKDYDGKEAALITYLAANPNDQLARQIAEKQQILSALQSGKDTAIKTIVDKEIESRTQIIGAYLAAQSTNRLIAFNKEQEVKTKLLTAYLDAEITNRVTAVSKDYEGKLALFKAYADSLIAARVAAFQTAQDAKSQLFNAYAGVETSSKTAVINKQVEARLAQLGGSYAEQEKLQQLLTEAQSLKNRVQTGSASRTSATANSLAIMLLQASAFTTGAALPVNLQIPMDQLSDLNATPDQQLHDLSLLIEVLGAKLRETTTAIDQQTRALQNTEGYTLLPDTTASDSPLRQAVKQKYDDLLKVGDLAKYSDNAAPNSDLSQALIAKYKELFGVDELSKIAAETPFTSTLSMAIQKEYPDLFQIGDWAKLSDSVSSTNPLALSAEEKSKALLLLDGLENVITYSSTNAPITKAVDQLQQDVNQLQSQLESESAKKQYLVRARDLAWSTFNSLATKIAEMGISSQAQGSVVRMATAGVVPTAPVGPKKTSNTLIGLVLGLLLGVGIAFLAGFRNNSVRNENQINKLLSLPVIGTIPEGVVNVKPRVKTGDNGHEAPVVSLNLATLDPNSPVTEAFRLLRHNLLMHDPAWRVIAVASATPVEGRSTVAANLATIVARAGKQVVLVDADFRRPAQHELFGVKNDSGLTDILNGAVDTWAAYAQTTPVDGLRLVTSGALPPDPAALLESPALRRWLDLLKQSVDVVIVDTPPAVGLADALIVASAADATLLVVGADRVSERDVVRAKELLATAPAPLVGVVLNRTSAIPGARAYAALSHAATRSADDVG